MAPIPVNVPQEIEPHIAVMRLFNAKVDHLDRSGFAVRYADDVPQVTAKFADVSFKDLGSGQFNIVGRVESWLENFNQDEIDAFVLTYRMFTQNNDPISLGSLAKIYESGWIPVEGQEYFSSARSDIQDYLSRAATVSFGEHQIAIGQLVEIVIYGGMAHTNLQKAAIFNSWQASGCMGFIWAEFHTYARFMLDRLRYLRHLNAQILNAIDDGTAVFLIEREEGIPSS